MITTVTTKNMVSIPAKLSRELGIVPGCRLEWAAAKGVKGSRGEIQVRVIPKRGELARRLKGAGKRWAPERDAVRELVEARVREDDGR